MSGILLAADLGGSHVEYGLVRDASLLASGRFPVRKTCLELVLAELEKEVRSLISRQSVTHEELEGVAVGICAIVDGDSKVKAANGKYEDGVGFSFPQWAMKTFGLQGKAENDTRMALLGEHFAGAARGSDDAMLMTLGTGIGGAVMLGGKLMRSGSDKAGGLAGHLGVDWQGRVCTCGNRGCAEAEASTVALDAICREHHAFAKSVLSRTDGAIDFEQLFAAADAGDQLAAEVLARCVGVWSALTVTLIHAYDPQVMVFGGGVMRRADWILPQIREYVERYAWAEKDSVRIVATELGASAALLGAVPLLRGVA